MPPDNLSLAAVTEWNVLADVLTRSGALVESDLRALALLCETLATEAGLREILKGGLMLTSGKAHPAYRMLITTRQLATRLFSDFGLSPKARQSVDMHAPTEPEENPWDAIKRM